MGDGINDAPSLKAADVGISVNNAVDVAKESADLILMHKSLKDLVNGVIQGRKTFANTLKYLMMGLSSNFGNMFSMAGASLFFPFLPCCQPKFCSIIYCMMLRSSSSLWIMWMLSPKKTAQNEYPFFPQVYAGVWNLSSVFDFITFFVLTFMFHYTNHAFEPVGL